MYFVPNWQPVFGIVGYQNGVMKYQVPNSVLDTCDVCITHLSIRNMLNVLRIDKQVHSKNITV